MMDPNETLRLLRDATRHMNEVGHAMDEQTNECVRTVVELFEALDGWLSAGGFPPEAWREGPDAIGSNQGEVPSSQGPDAVAEDRQGPGMVPDLLAQAYAEPLGPPNPAHGELPD